MIETEKIEELLREQGIIKSFVLLDNSIFGYYYCDGNYKIILMNQSIKNDERLYRSVLAEEIGHHMTTYGDITQRKHSHYCTDNAINKQEDRSIKWATDFLIPTKSLIAELKDRNLNSPYDLEDSFLVTRQFLMKKFMQMAYEKPIWELDSERYLYLYNFPSICILNSPKDNEAVLEEIFRYE
ncbi:MAG: ImmA/IrrE family metallo-endopeptidase [Clostridia bacterium]|jgi:Zn-dependent peptidase ImmA (M78 family)